MGLFDGLFASDAERDEPDDATMKRRVEKAIRDAKSKPARMYGDEIFADQDDDKKKGGLW